MILVSWDQAGCGQSYLHNSNPKNLIHESLVNDAHELTQYLKKKFNKEKIFLVGFSYGSVIGMKLAEKYPDDYYAYIGVSQVISLSESWDVSMQWLKDQAQQKNDTTALMQLDLIEKKDSAVCATILDCFMSKYELVVKYGGTVYDTAIAKEIEKAETMYEDYKDYDWFEAFNYTSARMDGVAFTTDISDITELKIPLYFLGGRHDWNLPSVVAENHLNKMTAPKKKFIWSKKSGHRLADEEDQKFTLFAEDPRKRYMILMGVPESVDTTEVGVFFDSLGYGKTKIDISSLSSRAKRIAAEMIFQKLDRRFGQST
jgi:pimeloyl-ACP methyl ester carboxylesterase